MNRMIAGHPPRGGWRDKYGAMVTAARDGWQAQAAARPGRYFLHAAEGRAEVIREDDAVPDGLELVTPEPVPDASPYRVRVWIDRALYGFPCLDPAWEDE